MTLAGEWTEVALRLLKLAHRESTNFAEQSALLDAIEAAEGVMTPPKPTPTEAA
jgi:hypothetical protein